MPTFPLLRPERQNVQQIHLCKPCPLWYRPNHTSLAVSWGITQQTQTELAPNHQATLCSTPEAHSSVCNEKNKEEMSEFFCFVFCCRTWGQRGMATREGQMRLQQENAVSHTNVRWMKKIWTRYLMALVTSSFPVCLRNHCTQLPRPSLLTWTKFAQPFLLLQVTLNVLGCQLSY